MVMSATLAVVHSTVWIRPLSHRRRCAPSCGLAVLVTASRCAGPPCARPSPSARHPEMPLIALLGLGHLGIALLVFVLGRTGRRDQRGIDDCAPLHGQPLLREHSGHFGEDRGRQIVLFQQGGGSAGWCFRRASRLRRHRARQSGATTAHRATLLPSPGRNSQTTAAGSECATSSPAASEAGRAFLR